MVSTSDFKNGMAVIIDGDLYTIESFQHVKPGKGGAFVRTRLRNMKTSNILDKTFNAGVNLGQAYIDTRKMEYLYFDGSHYVFMDTNNYEQMEVEEETLGDLKDLLKENTVLTVKLHDNSIIGIELPNSMELEITYTEPGFKGDTAQGGSKPATVETGAVIQVPLFVNQGDKIKIDTRTREYLGRV